MNCKDKNFCVFLQGAIVACVAAALPAPLFAQTGLAGIVPDSVLESAGSQSVEGRQVVRDYIAGDNPVPRAVAARAAVAIRALAMSGLYSDPADLLAAAENIAAAAQPALCPPRVMHALVPENFTLPEGVAGYDFGPDDSRIMPGFEPIRDTDERLTGANSRGVHRPGDNRLLSDGIVGVLRFTTPMANGVHRIVLLTGETEDKDTLRAPFGVRLVVNGKIVDLGEHPSNSRLREAVLQNPDLPVENSDLVSGQATAGAPGGGLQRGGALMVEVGIANGRLELEMQQPGGVRDQSTYLVGLLAAPIARGNVIGRYFDAAEAVLDTDQCLALEEEINTAITELIEDIAPAAGPQDVRGLPGAVFEDGASSSSA